MIANGLYLVAVRQGQLSLVATLASLYPASTVLLARYLEALVAADKKPILDQFEHQAHPHFATARIWDDGVIDPADTRRVLALALSASLNAPIPDAPKFGVFRM